MIGVFDSGIGGLSVLRQLMKVHPKQSFLYLGDTARLPYGTKSKSTIENYVDQNIDYLIKKKVKLIVCACHSASTVLIEQKENKYSVPVLNVIAPSSKALKESDKPWGLIGTQATVSSGLYQKLCPGVKTVAAPLLVPLVEEGWTDDDITDQVLNRYLKELKSVGVVSLILGCTHFPLLMTSLRKSLGEKVKLIDPGVSVAEEVTRHNLDYQKSLSSKCTSPTPRVSF